jgi:hypothetical protein
MVVTDMPPLPGEVAKSQDHAGRGGRSLCRLPAREEQQGQNAGGLQADDGLGLSVIDPAKRIDQITKHDVRATKRQNAGLPGKARPCRRIKRTKMPPEPLGADGIATA